MAVSDDLLKQKLRQIFNLNHFANSKQKEAVKKILKRDQDVIVSMASGNRKSLCFQLPGIMEDNKISVVCSASASSIKNHIHYLRKCKIDAKSIATKMNDDERKQLTDDLTKETPTTRFIYVTPDQATNGYFTNILRTLMEKDKLVSFAVDDAHLASPRLQDFCQDYLKFGALRPAYPSIPWIALTHNASSDVSDDIVQSLQLREPIAKFTKSTFRKNLHYDIIYKNTTLDLFAHLQNFVTSRLEIDGGKKASGIIYCNNRERVDMVVRKLSERGLSTKAHHGGMTSKDRKKVLDEWKAGVLPVITTTTTSLGSGIDKSTIRVVVHFNVPQSVVGFYKESGVAGRDGKLSYCRIYYCKTDVAAVDTQLKSDIAKVKSENDRRKALRAHADFLKMSGLCETVDCRHKIFSNYFDDTVPNCNGKCDVCDDTQAAKVALELFYQFSATPTCETGRSDTLIVCPLIKPEPQIDQSTEHPQHSRSVSPANTIIKEEDDHSGNRKNYSNLSDELFCMQSLPPRDVSPGRTVVKEEPVSGTYLNAENHTNNSSACGTDSKHAIRIHSISRCVSPAETVIDEKPVFGSEHTTALSDELFGMRTLPPGNVSPARTVVKDELEDESRLGLMSPNSKSPTTTISGGATPQCSFFIKSEPKSPVRQINESGLEPLEHAISSLEPLEHAIRPLEQLEHTIRPLEQLEHAINPLEPFTGAENSVGTTTEILLPITPTVTSNATAGNNSFVVVVKQEAPQLDSTDEVSQRISGRESRSPSPTGTIIKDECMSPARNADFDGGFLENVPDNLANEDGEGVSKRLNVKTERRRSNSQCSSANKVHAVSNTKTIPPDHNSKIQRDPSTEPEFVSCKILDFREKNRPSSSNRSTIDDRISTSRQRNRTKDSHKYSSKRRSRSNERLKRRDERRGRNKRFKREKNDKSRSRSRSLSRERSRSRRTSGRRSRSKSKERFKRENEREGRSERYKREKNVNRCPRSRSLSRERSRSTSLARRRSRSISKDQFKRENERDRRSEQYNREKGVRRRSRSRSLLRERSRSTSLSRRRSRSRSKDRFKNENKRRRRSRSNDRKPSSSSSSKRYRNPYRSEQTSNKERYSSEKKTDVFDDRYGWQDPAPPKPIPEDQPKTADDNVIVQEKMKEFTTKLQNEYDLEVIEKSREELFRAIQESIAINAKKKLDDLTGEIQKKQDDYVLKLFGTDNFNSWDDDPALSNVENAKNIQSFKAHVPDDVPLYDKMSMKHVINVKKLKPTRVGNELVFHGHIKEIENQFQDQELPLHLMEAIKTEKEVIAGLVKKYLQPYYNCGRIQPKELFIDVARQISHVFYGRYADKNIIRQYIDDLFKKHARVTSSTDLTQ